MKCRLIAAGTRLPDWVNQGFANTRSGCARRSFSSSRRFRSPPAGPARIPQRAIAREGSNMLAALGPKDYVVALEVAGSSMTTEAAERLVGDAPA